MNINTYINSYNFATQLSDINNLLTIAQISVTYCGSRVITLEKYEGSFSIDEFALKVLRAASQRCDADDLTTKERLEGIEITDKLRNFYKITDNRIKSENCFTKFLNFTKEFTFNPYTARFHTEVGMMEHYFRGYSEERFKQEFGESKKSKDDIFYENSDGCFSAPLRIMACESAIRAKLGK